MICHYQTGHSQTMANDSDPGANSFRKIKITENNNSFLNFNIHKVYEGDSLSMAEADILREYVLKESGIKPQDMSELELCTTLMDWVNKQWVHDGWNNAGSLKSIEILCNAKKGERYRCVEYGKVLSDILKSMGIVSRVVSLQSEDVAYGGAGSGHVASEVWINEFNKWVFMDPQYNMWFLYKNKPLSYYDLYTLKKEFDNKRGSGLERAQMMTGRKFAPKDKSREYLNFLNRYFGYVGIRQLADKEPVSLFLFLAGNSPFLTFQGMPTGKAIFTNSAGDLYDEINQTMISIDYTAAEKERSKQAMANANLKEAKDFTLKMHLFCAAPDFVITLSNNMPWFEKYVLMVNGDEIALSGNSADVRLKIGMNVIEACSLNRYGVQGSKAVLHIKYL